MKGIKLCGECADYDIKKHRCKRGASREDDARNTFYDDCPLPDVAPVVHGEWIVNPKREYDYICSVCGGDAPENRWANNDMLTSYCPNCGAKMDGGEITMTTRRIISIKMTPDEIAEIIKAHLEAEGFEVGEDVDFSIETVTVGYGANEQDIKKFGGCKVTCSMVVGGK